MKSSCNFIYYYTTLYGYFNNKSIHWKVGHRRFQLALHVIFFLVLVLYWKCTHSKILLSNTKFLLTFSKIVTSFVILHTSPSNTHVILSKFLLVHQKYLYNVFSYRGVISLDLKYSMLSYNTYSIGPRHKNFTSITNKIYKIVILRFRLLISSAPLSFSLVPGSSLFLTNKCIWKS